MKRFKRSNRRTPFIIATLACAILIVIFLSASYATKTWPFASLPAKLDSTSKSINSHSNPGTDAPTSTKNPTDPTSNSVKNQTGTKKEPDSIETSLLSITSITAQDGNVTVRTLINKITTEGTCFLKITNTSNNRGYSKSAGVQALASSSTCQGFTVPISELSTGSWSINLNYVVDGVSYGKVIRTEQIDA